MICFPIGSIFRYLFRYPKPMSGNDENCLNKFDECPIMKTNQESELSILSNQSEIEEKPSLYRSSSFTLNQSINLSPTKVNCATLNNNDDNEFINIPLEFNDDNSVVDEDKSRIGFDKKFSLEEINLNRLEHRIDFQLPEPKFQNMYLAAFTSHAKYWSDANVGMFILDCIFCKLSD